VFGSSEADVVQRDGVVPGKDDDEPTPPLRVTQVAGILAAALGAAVLAGWATGSGSLLRLRPDLPSMHPATAVCFGCLGAALVAAGGASRGRRRVRHLAVAAAAAAGTVAALSLLKRAGGPDVSLENVVFAVAVTRTGYPESMAVATCILVLVLAAGLLALVAAPRRGELPAQVLGLVGLIGSLAAVLEHLYGERAPALDNVRSVMAVHTAVGLAVVSIGLLAAVPGGPAARVLERPGPGSTLRRLVLVLAVAMPTLGWLRVQGERQGLYDTSFGVAIMVLAAGALACASAWRAAAAADRSGAMLRDAWQRLGTRNASLERRVTEQAEQLAEAHARLRDVLDVVADAVVVTDAAGRVTMASTGAAQLLGQLPAELAGRPLDALGVVVRRAAGGRAHVLAVPAVPDVTAAAGTDAVVVADGAGHVAGVAGPG
jgi:two-component system cell cycle sensor histidine kinase/response regulator CckA